MASNSNANPPAEGNDDAGSPYEEPIASSVRDSPVLSPNTNPHTSAISLTRPVTVVTASALSTCHETSLYDPFTKNVDINFDGIMMDVVVASVNYESYFASLYKDLANAVAARMPEPPTFTIDITDFIAVCCYLLNARVATVHAQIRGVRPTEPTRLPRGYCVPTPLACLLNRIGAVEIHNGATLIVPKPERISRFHAPSNNRDVDFDMLTNFQTFVWDVQRAHVSDCGFITQHTGGTSWWILSARRATNPHECAFNDKHVLVVSDFPQYSSEDVRRCAIVQNGLDGCLPDDFSEFETCGRFTDAHAHRSNYNLTV